MTVLIRHELSIIGNWVVTSLKLADQDCDQTWSLPVKFDIETVENRCLELVWNRSVFSFVKASDKIIFLKQSFQLEII